MSSGSWIYNLGAKPENNMSPNLTLISLCSINRFLLSVSDLAWRLSMISSEALSSRHHFFRFLRASLERARTSTDHFFLSPDFDEIDNTCPSCIGLS